jgi:hypothetical protein
MLLPLVMLTLLLSVAAVVEDGEAVVVAVT